MKHALSLRARTLLDRIGFRRARSIPDDAEMARLLGREPVNLDTPQLQRFIAGKRVLITGAGGSIGSEIARQVMRFCPRQVVLLERSENGLFEIERELRERWVGADLVALLADMTDRRRIDKEFAVHRPQVVFHCAAHKHVPMMERNAPEAVRNNVFGTRNVADATRACGAQAFVMVSTDKAVNPTSVMGATKRCAELYVQSMNSPSSSAGADLGLSVRDDHAEPPAATRFVAVRFGNVLSSSGSVVPIWRKQIAAGGPVTVTHREMRRYFMTIREAAGLVMQAGAIGHGGEVFVLDMGSPVRIADLAEAMVRRSGLRPGRDIEIRVTGMREGEKLYEELACDNERTSATGHRQIRVWRLPRVRPREASNMLEILDQACARGERSAVIEALREIVPEYSPPSPNAESTPLLRLVEARPDAEAA